VQAEVFQTPIPAAGSEIWIGIAILLWTGAVVLLSRRFSKMWRYFGEIVSFLVYVLGLVLLEFLVL
jgi:hypothetical protein